MPDKTGISQGSLKIIEKKVMQMNLQEREHTLCMDEISLKTNLFYSVPSGKIRLATRLEVTPQKPWFIHN